MHLVRFGDLSQNGPDEEDVPLFACITPKTKMVRVKISYLRTMSEDRI